MRPSQSTSRPGALLCALLVISKTALAAVAAPPATNGFFGTITLGDQEAEHERVTRAALECPAGVPSDDTCFEPKSILSLAGGPGTGGAVGASDLGTGALEAKAHCDDADYLDFAKYGIEGQYGQTRETANGALIGCLDYLRGYFQAGVKAAGELLDSNGQVIRDEADLGSLCTYSGLSSRAKCQTYDGLGRALHGLEDFYSHSNWVDVHDESQPISASNPPGLNRSDLAPFLAMRNATVNVTDIPSDFSTGCFVLGWQDGTKGEEKCVEQGRNVTHVVLNKDNGDIRVTPNASVPDGPALTENSRTTRGQIADNYERAVVSAVLEARRQWADFRAAIVDEYGVEKGALIVCALTRDQPWRACGLASLNGGGGDKLATNTTYVIDVNATVPDANNSTAGETRIFKYTADEAERLNITVSLVNETSPLVVGVSVVRTATGELRANATVNNGSSSAVLNYLAADDEQIDVVIRTSGLEGNQTAQYSIKVDSSVDLASAAYRAAVPLAAVLLSLLLVLATTL